MHNVCFTVEHAFSDPIDDLLHYLDIKIGVAGSQCSRAYNYGHTEKNKALFFPFMLNKRAVILN